LSRTSRTQRFREGVCHLSRKRRNGKKADTDNADGKEVAANLRAKVRKGFGRLVSGLDVRDALAVEGNGGSHDDKNMTIFEKKRILLRDHTEHPITLHNSAWRRDG
jgi:hypothetical protein